MVAPLASAQRAGDRLVEVFGEAITSMRQIFPFAREAEEATIERGLQRGDKEFAATMNKSEASVSGRRRRRRRRR